MTVTFAPSDNKVLILRAATFPPPITTTGLFWIFIMTGYMAISPLFFL